MLVLATSGMTKTKFVTKAMFYVFKQKMYDTFVQIFLADINNSSICMSYRNIIDHFLTTVLFAETHSLYLQKNNNKKPPKNPPKTL